MGTLQLGAEATKDEGGVLDAGGCGLGLGGRLA